MVTIFFVQKSKAQTFDLSVNTTSSMGFWSMPSISAGPEKYFSAIDGYLPGTHNNDFIVPANPDSSALLSDIQEKIESIQDLTGDSTECDYSIDQTLIE